jgi:hypothetical protein
MCRPWYAVNHRKPRQANGENVTQLKMAGLSFAAMLKVAD